MYLFMNLLLINLISTVVHTNSAGAVARHTHVSVARHVPKLSVQTHAQKGHKAAPLPGADQPLTSK